MSGIRSRGRRGTTNVPNWRWEDQSLDPYDLRVAGWLASHADSYLADNVTRNEIARCLGMARTRVSKSVETLTNLGIIEVHEAPCPASGTTKWVIEFDFDVWERDPEVGRHTSWGRTPDVLEPGRHTSSSIEQQEEVEREPPYSPPADRFEQFWESYPRHTAKARAERAWRTLSKRDRAACLLALPAWLADQQRQPRRTKSEWLTFLPHPTTFLNQRRWEDEIAPAPAAKINNWREKVGQP